MKLVMSIPKGKIDSSLIVPTLLPMRWLEDMLMEKHMEDLIAAYPDDFLEPGWKLHQRQGIYEGRRIDLVFKDKHERMLLVELYQDRQSVLDLVISLPTHRCANQKREGFSVKSREPIHLVCLNLARPKNDRLQALLE